MTPLDFVRGELGQKEIPDVSKFSPGQVDNNRIRQYFKYCANIGSKEYPDEIPWCSALLNAAAFQAGYLRTDNALAISWKQYGTPTIGDYVPMGAIVVIRRADGGHHVTLADRSFNKRKAEFFRGIGGNQKDSVCVSTFRTSQIVATRNWIKLL